MSVVVERPINYKPLRELLATKFDDNTLKLLDLGLDGTTQVLDHSVQVGNDLENMCKKSEAPEEMFYMSARPLK
jgi:hypothetical protein